MTEFEQGQRVWAETLYHQTWVGYFHKHLADGVHSLIHLNSDESEDQGTIEVMTETLIDLPLGTYPETIKRLIEVLKESEIIALEIHRPPTSRVRELWPFTALPLIQMFEALLPQYELMDTIGVSLSTANPTHFSWGYLFAKNLLADLASYQDERHAEEPSEPQS